MSPHYPPSLGLVRHLVACFCPFKDAGDVPDLSHRCLHSCLPDEVSFVAVPEDFATPEAGTMCTKPRDGRLSSSLVSHAMTP